MIVVTGGAGFIGSNLIKGLNQRGIKDILVVDHLKAGEKFVNLAALSISDYMDKEDFLEKIKQQNGYFPSITAVFHQGACSTTTEWDGRFMMKNNYEYSKELLHYCQAKQIPFLYASSAAVYGNSTIFQETPQYECPLNVYGYSKLLFDQYVRRVLPSSTAQITGFRYFNVYGPGEQHKGSMASVALHLHEQLRKGEKVKLFEGSDQYGPGEQRRDFVYVEDVVNVNLWFYDHPTVSGIFNVGTGNSQSFNDVARAVVAWHQRGAIEYIPFPAHLKGRYQSFTQADIRQLRAAGFAAAFHSVETGVPCYLDSLQTST